MITLRDKLLRAGRRVFEEGGRVAVHLVTDIFCAVVGDVVEMRMDVAEMVNGVVLGRRRR